MIRVRGLRKKYGKKEVLKGISFTIPDKGVIAFVGPNGAGKTTTIKAILGLVRYEGEIEVEGGIRSIGYSPEVPTTPSWMRVRDFVNYVESVYGKYLSENLDLIKDLMNEKLGKLSKGQRKRVLISVALSNWRYSLLDEPFTGLDVKWIEIVKDRILSVKNKTGILISSHILKELEDLADGLVVIDEGRIVFEGKEISGETIFITFESEDDAKSFAKKVNGRVRGREVTLNGTLEDLCRYVSEVKGKVREVRYVKGSVIEKVRETL